MGWHVENFSHALNLAYSNTLTKPIPHFVVAHQLLSADIEIEEDLSSGACTS